MQFKMQKRTSIILTFNVLLLMGILNIIVPILKSNPYEPTKFIANIIGILLLIIAFVLALKKENKKH